MNGPQVRLPAQENGLDQDQEYLYLVEDGHERRIRFHDYDEIYAVPGLYERVFAEMLECVSPTVIADLLAEQVNAADQSMGDLRILDLGAGNGMVGEALRAHGAGKLYAADIIQAAADAAGRDRPGQYERYVVGDIRDPAPDDVAALRAADINCLSCVAALGFADSPATAFSAAYDYVAEDGWVAFNIKDRFLERNTGSDFVDLIGRLVDEGKLEITVQKTYQHRLSISGEPLHYVAIIARKREPRRNG